MTLVSGYTNHVLQGIRNTRICITGHPVPNLFLFLACVLFFETKKGKNTGRDIYAFFIQIKGEKRKGKKKGKKRKIKERKKD